MSRPSQTPSAPFARFAAVTCLPDGTGGFRPQRDVLDAIRAPGQREWFLGCRRWIGEAAIRRERSDALPAEPPPLDSIFGPARANVRDFPRSVSELHWRIAGALDSHGFGGGVAREALIAIAREHQFPKGLVLDLAAELSPHAAEPALRGPFLSGQLRAATDSLTLPILFSEGAGAHAKGVVGWLTLDRVEDIDGPEPGGFHPAPSHAFLDTAFAAGGDEPWRKSQDDARAALVRLGLWPAADAHDLRWTVAFRDPAFRQISGPSAGAALALAGARLFGTGEPWNRLNLAGIAVTASVAPDGTLGPVGFVPEKILAAAREQAVPRIVMVLVCMEDFEKFHALGLVKDDAHPRALRDPNQELVILGAATLVEAARRIVAHVETRFFFPTIVTAPGVQVRSAGVQLGTTKASFVPREDLDVRLESLLADRAAAARCLVLVGGAGRGKTAWITARLNDERRAGRAPVFYFVAYRSGTGCEAIAQGLCAQLMLKHALPLPDVPAKDGSLWTERLQALLARVSAKLPRDDDGHPEPEVLVVEAADQADAARQLFAGLFKPDLPAGIWVLFTTRQDERWRNSGERLRRFDFLSCGEMAAHEAIDPSAAAAGYRAAVRRFLENGARKLDPPPAPDLIPRIFAEENRAPIFLTVVERMRRLREGDAKGRVSLETLRTEPAPWLLDEDERAAEFAADFEDALRDLWSNPATLAPWPRVDPVRAGWLLLALLDLGETWGRGFSLAGLRELLAPVAVRDETLTVPAERQRDEERVHLVNDLRGFFGTNADRILAEARNFFAGRPRVDPPALPYFFEHPSYNRLVRDRVAWDTAPEEEAERARAGDFPVLHTLLAGAALDLWPRHAHGASGEYALDRLVAHHVHAGRVRAIAPVLTSAEFALARMRRHGIVAYYLDTTLAQQPAVAGEAMLAEELAAWERFWRFRVERLRSLSERTEPGAIEAVMRQEIRSERRVP